MCAYVVLYLSFAFVSTLTLLLLLKMDKFIVKRRKLNDASVEENSNSKPENELVSSGSSVQSAQSVQCVGSIRKYHDSYLNFGFTHSGSEDCPIPECVVCGEKLSNESMVPSKLKRHFNTKHSHLSGKNKTYFSRLLSSEVKQAKVMEKRATIADKAQVASYKVAEIIAVKMQPHTIAEDLILPACKEIVKSILGDAAEKEISVVPLSNDTISRRIDDMSSDIQKNVGEILSDGRLFAMQLDESTDISKKCQLLSYIRFVADGSITEQFFSCTELLTTSTGLDIYNSISSTLEKNGLSWKNCISICTDGAPAMTGRLKGFVSRLKQKFPSIGSTHCFIHREVLVTKTLPAELKDILDSVVKMVNYVKSRALKTRLLKQMCQEAGSRHDTLVLHTDIRWLSRGKVLTRFYELRDELINIFALENMEFVTQLKDEDWCAKLAYLADIFSHLNCLNTSMQGREENLLTSSDKLNGFLRKLKIWKLQVEKKHFEMFPLASDADPDGEVTSDLISNHLSVLEGNMKQYFPSLTVNEFDWVRNPYAVSPDSTTHLPLEKAEQLAELQEDRTLQLKYGELSLVKFWLLVEREYPAIAKDAVSTLLPFSTTYLCELGFSALTNIKNKKRERLMSVEQEMRVCLSTIRPRIEFLCKKKQAHVSH